MKSSKLVLVRILPVVLITGCSWGEHLKNLDRSLTPTNAATPAAHLAHLDGTNTGIGEVITALNTLAGTIGAGPANSSAGLAAKDTPSGVAGVNDRLERVLSTQGLAGVNERLDAVLGKGTVDAQSKTGLAALAERLDALVAPQPLTNHTALADLRYRLDLVVTGLNETIIGLGTVKTSVDVLRTGSFGATNTPTDPASLRGVNDRLDKLKEKLAPLDGIEQNTKALHDLLSEIQIPLKKLLEELSEPKGLIEFLTILAAIVVLTFLIIGAARDQRDSLVETADRWERRRREQQQSKLSVQPAAVESTPKAVAEEASTEPPKRTTFWCWFYRSPLAYGWPAVFTALLFLICSVILYLGYWLVELLHHRLGDLIK